MSFSIVIHRDRVAASITHSALLAALDHDVGTVAGNDHRIALTISTNITHRKRGARLVIAGNALAEKIPDPNLVALIAKAHRARAALFSSAAPRGNRHIERLARLAYLAPDITSAILNGTQPATLTSLSLLKLPGLPLEWTEQQKMLKFA